MMIGDDLSLIKEIAVFFHRKILKITHANKMHKPAFMMVLCGIAPFAYKREDGVFVVPISCLKD